MTHYDPDQPDTWPAEKLDRLYRDMMAAPAEPVGFDDDEDPLDAARGVANGVLAMLITVAVVVAIVMLVLW